MVFYYDDDEPIVQVSTQQAVDSGEPEAYDDGDTKLTHYNRTQASLKESKLKVLLELTGSEHLKDRFPLDLVAVLDVSGSMHHDNKIGILKRAMEFVIRKLSSTDRLSIVTYSDEANMIYPQRLVTDRFQDDIINRVKALRFHGRTNTFAGLQMGVKVLNDRRFTEDRTGAILLMSDGDQTLEYGDARNIRVDQFPVHTFALGKESTTELLEELSNKSDGGTFTDVLDETNLSRAFALCLGGLLSVVVKDLKLTIKHFDKECAFEDVSAGKYFENIKWNNDRSHTISIGDLYSREVRKILVHLHLFSANKEKSAQVLRLSHSYSPISTRKKGKLFVSPSLTIKVDRYETAIDEEIPNVIIEDKRTKTVDYVNEARELAENGDFPAAKDKMNAAKGLLESVKGIADPKMIIKALLADVEKLLELMATPDKYKFEGIRLISSFLSSQHLQRAVDGYVLHSTPLTREYIVQAVRFVKNPNRPPPNQDDDLKIAQYFLAEENMAYQHQKQGKRSLQLADEDKY